MDSPVRKRLRSPYAFAIAAAGLCLVCLLAIALAECAARLCLPAYIGPVSEAGPYKHLVLLVGPRGTHPPTRLTTNRWGLRGEEPPRDWRAWDTWLALGSSTTLGYHLDDSDAWPARVQQRLRAAGKHVWIGNAAQDGLTTAGIAMEMEALAKRIKPRNVLILAGGSEMALTFSDDRRERGSPYDRAFAKRAARADTLGGWKDYSRLYREYQLLRKRRAHETVTLSVAAHASRFPAPLTGAEDSLSLDSLAGPTLAVYSENLRGLQARARTLGIRAVFLTQPYLYGVDSAWAHRFARSVTFRGREYRISAATERRLLDRFNAALLGLCAGDGLECFDLASRMAGDSLRFYDEGHFTAAGADLAAAEIAGYLLTPRRP